ncbi:hypothetical protein CE91St41_21860 [Oscillospiraceae bacterium]|nr:hypothetical protein CE91St40_15680 [Oscillospiraceae bacterium]BDF75297.1 hypothetical protein CE91St41_21860 [Oscillospiraceae bacterium]
MKTKRNWNRCTAWLLCAALCLTLLPAAALAEGAGAQLITLEQIYSSVKPVPPEDVYQLEATVYAAYDEDSGLLYLGGYADSISKGDMGRMTLPVEPRADAADLKAARPGDHVVIQGGLERWGGSAGDSGVPGSFIPPQAKLCRASALSVTPNPLRGVENGGVYLWTDGGHLVIPPEITRLTIRGDGAEMDGWIEAVAPGVELTVEDLHLSLGGERGMGIICPDGSLTVRGGCTVKGGQCGLFRISELVVEEGASLSLDDNGCGIQMELSEVTGGGENRMRIDGSLRVASTATGINIGTFPAVLDGSGSLVCGGSHMGIFLVSLELGGSLSLVVSGGESKFGLGGLVYAQTAPAAPVTVGEHVTGLIFGGVYRQDQAGLSYGPVGGGLIVVPEAPAAGDPSVPLDLSNETGGKTYLYREQDGALLGAAAWTPAAGDAPARFSLVSANRTGNGLYLAGGVVFPEHTAVDVSMSANSAIENGEGPAVSAPGCTLTLHTGCLGGTPGEDWRPSLYGDPAISAPGGTVAFTGGDFQVYGVADVPVRLEGGLGEVAFQGGEGPDGMLPAVPRGVTVDPAGAGDAHAEIRRYDGTALVSPSNRAISYGGDENLVVAAIAAGALDEPAPTPSGGGGGVSTYAVTYKANYDKGPADVRDAGYSRGATVTVKGADTFAAPEGMAFSGWAEAADGPVKYAPGDTFKMPAGPVALYAVWAAAPALNRAEHIAYLEGYPDGRIGPEDLLTREQTAAIFYRLLTPDSRARYQGAASPFPDVADGRWSAGAIAAMASAGILKGRPDGSFAPERPVTRAEFAAIAARFDSEEYGGADLFPDIAGHWAAGEINRAGRKGWVRGGSDGLFRPDDPITRAEAAALINRVLERAPETADDLLPGMRTFPDNRDSAAWYYLDLQEAANGHEFERRDGGVYERWTALHT